MADAGPIPEVSRLADRLRELWEGEFIRLTQSGLDCTVSGVDGPLKLATISNWENPASGHAVPESRMSTPGSSAHRRRPSRAPPAYDGGPAIDSQVRLTLLRPLTTVEDKEQLLMQSRQRRIRKAVRRKRQPCLPQPLFTVREALVVGYALLTSIGGAELLYATHRPISLIAFSGFGIFGLALKFFDDKIE
jgi:hypothetical protein